MAIRNQNQIILGLLVTLVGLFVLTRPRETIVVSSSSSSPPTTTSPTPQLLLEVGLPRSGSIAIYEYFQCQSSTTTALHYCCDSAKSRFPCPEHKTIGQILHQNALEGDGDDDDNDHKSLFDGCGDSSSSLSTKTRVITAMGVEASDPYGYFLPQHFALPLLYKDSPNAVWILPLRRDASTWATAVLHWHSETQRFLASFGLRPETRIAPANDQEAARITKGLQAAVEHAYSAQSHALKRQQLQGIYDSHTQKVRAFAQKHSIRLIEINVDDASEARRVLQTEFPTLSQRSDCWSFDPSTIDDDWKNLTLPF